MLPDPQTLTLIDEIFQRKEKFDSDMSSLSKQEKLDRWNEFKRAVRVLLDQIFPMEKENAIKRTPDHINFVYNFIAEYIGKNGFPPSQREIAVGCYLSRSSVALYLDHMVKLNWIRRSRGMSRSIILMRESHDVESD